MCLTGYQVIPLTGVTDSCLTPTDITNLRCSHYTLLISPFTDSSPVFSGPLLPAISHLTHETVAGAGMLHLLLPNTLTDSSRMK